MSAVKENKKRITPTYQQAIGKILVCLGLLVMFSIVQWQTHQKTKLSFAKITEPTPVVISRAPQPTFINIPKIRLSMYVYQTQIHGDIWEVSKNGASHLETSGNPTENRAIVLYSHNTTDKFGPIRWLAIGDEIRITTQDGITHTYLVDEQVTVKPTQTDILTTSSETLILYTCDGFADTMRYVLKAVPASEFTL